MPHCVYCGEPLHRSAPARQAYDPELGRLWEICPRCERWSPVPLELRWETLETWERRVASEGRVLLTSEHLQLIRVGEEEVVRVGTPSYREWGGWRYGNRLPTRRGGNFLRRALSSLPPPPLEGYDPYGFGGVLGGVSGRYGPSEWIASPFLEQAWPLTLAFSSIPFALRCPSCDMPMPIQPWDLSAVTFHLTSNDVMVEADCGGCGARVPLGLAEVRPAMRLGLAIVDSEPAARALGERAGEEIDRVGGARALLRVIARREAGLGELPRIERVALGMALDQEAEAEALESEWREAEEIAAIMDGELTEVPGFREFRARVLGMGS